MCCLGWLLNLGFAGSPGIEPAEPTFTGLRPDAIINSFVLPRMNIWDYVVPLLELKNAYEITVPFEIRLWDYVQANVALDNALHHEVVLNVKFVNGIALIGDFH